MPLFSWKLNKHRLRVLFGHFEFTQLQRLISFLVRSPRKGKSQKFVLRNWEFSKLLFEFWICLHFLSLSPSVSLFLSLSLSFILSSYLSPSSSPSSWVTVSFRLASLISFSIQSFFPCLPSFTLNCQTKTRHRSFFFYLLQMFLPQRSFPFSKFMYGLFVYLSLIEVIQPEPIKYKYLPMITI